MFHFIDQISGIIQSVIGMVVNIVQMLISLFTTMPVAINYIQGAIAYLPPFVGGVVIVSIAIAITITVVNHWG